MGRLLCQRPTVSTYINTTSNCQGKPFDRKIISHTLFLHDLKNTGHIHPDHCTEFILDEFKAIRQHYWSRRLMAIINHTITKAY
jgi:hypothetical protein